MAAYSQVYGVIHFTSPAGWLPVHRDQLRAQRSHGNEYGNNFTFTFIMVLPCDAMLARYIYAMALCLCLSVCHKSVFYQNG